MIKVMIKTLRKKQLVDLRISVLVVLFFFLLLPLIGFAKQDSIASIVKKEAEAFALNGKGQYKKAITICDAIIMQGHYQRKNCYIIRAYAWYNLENYIEAKKNIKKSGEMSIGSFMISDRSRQKLAQEIDDNLAVFLIEKKEKEAFLLNGQGQYKEASAICDDLIKFGVYQRKNCYIIRAYSLYGLGNYAEAQNNIKQSEIMPNGNFMISDNSYNKLIQNIVDKLKKTEISAPVIPPVISPAPVTPPVISPTPATPPLITPALPPATQDTLLENFTCGNPYIYKGTAYQTVLAGNKCWFKDNLNLGDMILTNIKSINNGQVEKYCLNDKEDKCNTIGALYTWDETMQQNGSFFNSQGICPNSWHVSSVADWSAVIYELDNYMTYNFEVRGSVGITKLFFDKISSKLNISTDNGFRAPDGKFYAIGQVDYWINEESNGYDKAKWAEAITFKSDMINRNAANKSYGMYARCVLND